MRINRLINCVYITLGRVIIKYKERTGTIVTFDSTNVESIELFMYARDVGQTV